MKTNVMKILLAISTVTVFGSALDAQSYSMKADIPFAFQVSNATLDPGTYTVSRGNTALPLLRNEVTRNSVFIANGATIGTAHTAKLVFHCYSGKQCFLAEIWPGAAGSSVPTSKAERNLSR